MSPLTCAVPKAIWGDLLIAVRWHIEPVIFETKNVAFDRLPDIYNRILTALTLGDASGKTRAFRHPHTVFAGIDKHLSHVGRIRGWP